MPGDILAVPLNKSDFSPFGSVIEKKNSNSFLINNGKCKRHHALALPETLGADGRVGISIFSGQPYSLPHVVDMAERHPLGSQAFYPLGSKNWLVVVFDDLDGIPVSPKAFLAGANQGINLNRGVWHGVLTPLEEASDFLVVDRIGTDKNLEEFHFGAPITVSVTEQD